jgi:O-antigen ligase
MSWLTVNLTLLAGLAVALGLLNVLAGAAMHRARVPIGWIIGVVVFASLGAFASPGSSYATSKTLALYALTLGCALTGALLLVRSERQRIALAWSTVGTGVLVAALAVAAPTTDDGRVALLDAATIGPARIVGAAAVVVTGFALAGRVRVMVALPLLAVFMTVTIATGSRGPVAAVVAAAAGMTFLLPVGRRVRSLMVLAVVGLGSLRILTNATSTVQDQFLLLFSDHKGASVSVRELLWSMSWEAIRDAPWAARGWGGMAAVLTPVSDYPHNIVFEVAGEGGLLALILLLVAFGVALRRSMRAARLGDTSALIVFALLVFWFVNTLVSGDLNDNRGLFVLIGAGIAIGRARSGEEPGARVKHVTAPTAASRPSTCERSAARRQA